MFSFFVMYLFEIVISLFENDISFSILDIKYC